MAAGQRESRGVNLVVASSVVAAIALLAWISWNGIGLGPCGGSGGTPNMDPSAAAYVVCEVQDPFKPNSAPGEPLSHELYELLLLTLPVQIVVVGTAFSRRRQRWRPFATARP
jgi:hypothetical protein